MYLIYRFSSVYHIFAKKYRASGKHGMNFYHAEYIPRPTPTPLPKFPEIPPFSYISTPLWKTIFPTPLDFFPLWKTKSPTPVNSAISPISCLPPQYVAVLFPTVLHSLWKTLWEKPPFFKFTPTFPHEFSTGCGKFVVQKWVGEYLCRVEESLRESSKGDWGYIFSGIGRVDHCCPSL